MGFGGRTVEQQHPVAIGMQLEGVALVGQLADARGLASARVEPRGGDALAGSFARRHR
jgi:hypothetical protein